MAWRSWGSLSNEGVSLSPGPGAPAGRGGGGPGSSPLNQATRGRRTPRPSPGCLRLLWEVCLGECSPGLLGRGCSSSTIRGGLLAGVGMRSRAGLGRRAPPPPASERRPSAGPARWSLAGFHRCSPRSCVGEVVIAHLLIVSLLSGNVKARVTPLNYGAGAGAGRACSGAC